MQAVAIMRTREREKVVDDDEAAAALARLLSVAPLQPTTLSTTTDDLPPHPAIMPDAADRQPLLPSSGASPSPHVPAVAAAPLATKLQRARTNARELLAEFVGTFLIVFIGECVGRLFASPFLLVAAGA